MYDFDLRRVRQTLDDGETVDADDVRTLADEVEVLRRRLREPTELHLTARIDPDHPGLWSIDHPLLMGTARAGSIPDALTLAAIDLRRALGTDDDDEQGVRRRVDRAEWEVLATSGGPAAEALAGAVRALELAEAERDEALAERDDHRWLRSGRSDRTGREQEEARRRVRERSLERLAAANVEGVDRRWADSGFGSASDHGLVLPALVVATSVRGDARDLRWRFDGGRRWVALEHRVATEWSSDHLVLVASLVEPEPAAERALRQLPHRLPDRSSSVGTHRHYADLLDELFGGAVSADRQRGDIGGGCWPLDLSSVAALTGGELDDEAPDGWVTEVDPAGRWFWSLPAWQLLWLGDAPDR